MSVLMAIRFQSDTALPAGCPCAEAGSPTTAANSRAVTAIDLSCMVLIPSERESPRRHGVARARIAVTGFLLFPSLGVCQYTGYRIPERRTLAGVVPDTRQAVVVGRWPGAPPRPAAGPRAGWRTGACPV